MTLFAIALSLLAGSALFGLGYIEGIRRGRGERKLELAVDVARTPGAFAVPEVRPQFCAPRDEPSKPSPKRLRAPVRTWMGTERMVVLEGVTREEHEAYWRLLERNAGRASPGGVS